MSLFGATSSRGSKKYLVEFKAGKMFLKGTMCHPDKRKGTVYINQSEDGLMHFCWKDRTSGKVDDDLIIFPGEVEFKKVTQCTTGRVYVLKFGTGRKFIFWLQEPKTDKDDEYCEKVNSMLNNPPQPGERENSSSGMGGLQASDLANFSNEADLQNLLQGMNPQQLMQLLGGMGGAGGSGGMASIRRPASGQSQSESTTPLRTRSAPDGQPSEAASPSLRPATAAPVPAAQTPTPSRGIQLSDLQSALSGLGGGASQTPPVDLSEALTSDVMIPLLSDAAVREQLTPFLPQDVSIPSSEQELRATATSPQFRQALSGFSQALSSGQLGPVLEQFGLGTDAVQAANAGDVDAFVKAMQNTNKKPEEERMDQD